MMFTNKSRNNCTDFASSVRNKKLSHQQLDHHEQGFPSLKSRVQRGNAYWFKLKIQSMGPICKARRKINRSLRIFDEEYEEENERWPNHDDDSCKWLLSGSSSPSCCFDDKIFGNLLDFSLDDWLASIFVLSENSTSSPVLSTATSFFDEFLREKFWEEETTTWLMKSLEVDDEFFQSYEDSKFVDDSVYPSKINFVSPGNCEFQERIWNSFLDHDEHSERSEWTSDSELNFLQIDFPSPLKQNSWGYNISQLSDLIQSIEYGGEAAFTKIENIGSDEPIFWPSVQSLDWSSEFSWDFFIMSPRKNVYEDEKLMGNLPEHFEFLLQNAGVDFRDRHKLWINSTMASPKILKQQRASLDVEDDIGKIFIEDIEVLEKHMMLLEEDFLGIEELTIEKFLGLNEFDGQEGIDLEFNKDCFLMDESFQASISI